MTLTNNFYLKYTKTKSLFLPDNTVLINAGSKINVSSKILGEKNEFKMKNLLF